jgi:5-methylcytosine-specific restriction endonuclease McrA
LRNHTKVYMNYFGYDISDFIPCEVCGQKAVDIHHIVARGIGGSKHLDTIQNLMALCRECHISKGDRKQEMEFLKARHLYFLVKK